MSRTIDYVSRGLFLIALGVVFFLINFGVLSWGFWLNVANLWPLILILGGLALLFGKRIPFSAVLLVFLLILVGYSMTFGTNFGWTNEYGYNYTPFNNGTTSGTLAMSDQMKPGIEKADVELNLGGAEMNLGSLSPEVSKEKTVEGEYSYRGLLGSGEPKFYSKAGTDKVDIKFSSEKRSAGKGTLNLDFSDKLIYNFDINAGAIDGDLDFTNLMVDKLELSTGASHLRLSFGDTGASTRADISGAASDIRLVVPETVGLRARFSGVASDTNFMGSGLLLDDKEWTSPNYQEAKTKIDLDISTAAGSVKLERPGSQV